MVTYSDAFADLPDERSIPMGDKSPKSNKKSKDQKNSKNAVAASKKKAADDAKSVPKKA